MGRDEKTKTLLVPLGMVSPEQDGHDELNLGRLSLISAQSRVPKNYTSWTRYYELEDRKVEVSCTALTGEVVPHGLDNDVMVAIINLYVEQGCAQDGTVRTNLHRLLSMAGLATSAHYYREVRRSLRRLQSTNYQIKQGWWVKGKERYVDASFSYLWKVTVSQTDNDEASSELEIRLPDEISLSICQGYVKPLDLSIYRELSSPPVRAVYRALDAMRWETGEPKETVTIGLLDWGERLNIYSREPDKIRRVLEPAHAELVECAVLRKIELQGRGKQQSVLYHFAVPDTGPDPILLRELTSRGMYPAVAGKYLTDEPNPAHVRQAIRLFDEYPGVKQNPGALLRSMLLHPEHYGEGRAISDTNEASPPEASSSQKSNIDEAALSQQFSRELRQLSPERLRTRLEHHLTFSGLRQVLSTQELEILTERTKSDPTTAAEAIEFIAQRLTEPLEITSQHFREKFLYS